MTEEEKPGSVEVVEENKPAQPEMRPSMEGKKDMNHLHEQIGSLIRTMTGKYDLSVTTQVDPMIRMELMRQGMNPDETWFARYKMDPATRRPTHEIQYVHIPEQIVVRSERIAMAIALHEAAHVVSSRMHVIPEDVERTLGFGALMAAAEERPTDQIVRERMPGMADWIDEARRDNIIDEMLEMEHAIHHQFGIPKREEREKAIQELEQVSQTEDEVEEADEESIEMEGKESEHTEKEITEPSVHDREFDLEAMALLRGLKGSSRFQQFTGLLVHEPQYSREELRALIDPAVLDAFEKIRHHIEFIEHTLPREKADEEEIDDQQMLRAATVYKRILPVAQELIDMDRKDARDRQMQDREMRKQMQEQEMSQEEKDEREAQRQELDELEKEQQELQEQMEKIENDESLDEDEKEIAKAELEKQLKESQEKQESIEQEMKEGLSDAQQEMQGMVDEIEDLQHEQQELQSQQMKIQHDDALDKEEKEVAMKELEKQMQESQEKMKEKQDELWDKIPDEIKEQIEQMVEQQMKDMEDQIMKDYEGDLSPEPMTTHEERDEQEREEEEERQKEEEREKERREEEEKRKEAQEEMDEAKKKLEELAKNKPIYEKEFQEIREVYEQLMEELDEILHPTTASQTTFTATGTKLNIHKLFLWSGQRGGGAKELTVKPFETVKIPEAQDYSIQLVVDLSGSMTEGGDYGGYWHDEGLDRATQMKKNAEAVYKGSRVDEAFKATICAAEVLDALGIRVSVVGFQDRLIMFKEFDEDLTDEIRERMSGMVYEAYDSNPGGNNGSGYNDDGKCVREASDLLEEEDTEEKIMIVLSDGQPAARHGIRDKDGRRVDAEEHLSQTVADIISFTDQKIVGLGLGQGTDHVSDYYPVSRPNINIHNLVENITEILRMVIVEPHILEQAAQEMRRQLGLSDGAGPREFTFSSSGSYYDDYGY